jgi:hypothetical protein
MRLEEAIAEMRKGSRCTLGSSRVEYFIDPVGAHIRAALDGAAYFLGGLFFETAFRGEWSIVETPLPLPRRFRAKLDGKPAVGVKFNHSMLPFCVDAPGKDTHRGWFCEADLTDLEYIDANS